MARASSIRLPQPVFHEPIFGEDGSLPDPTGFSTTHGSDTALYKQIGDLATKDVVAIPKSRIFTTPVGVSIRFAGLTSPWMTPAECAAESPAHVWAAIATA